MKLRIHEALLATAVATDLIKSSPASRSSQGSDVERNLSDQRLRDAVPPVSDRVSGRAIVWLAGGVLALLCALSIAGGAAWLMMHASGTYREKFELIAIAGVLLELTALFTGGLGWLALDHGRNYRSSLAVRVRSQPMRDPTPARTPTRRH